MARGCRFRARCPCSRSVEAKPPVTHSPPSPPISIPRPRSPSSSSSSRGCSRSGTPSHAATRSRTPRWSCPSMTLDQSELRKLPGASFYEERLLFLLIRLRNPRARMVYVTSQPVHPMILEYYFQLLAGIPASHARARLTLLCAYDASPRSLTEKILERPRLHPAHPRRHPGPRRAPTSPSSTRRRWSASSPCCSASRSTALDPELAHLGTKSGSRKVFREAGVPLPGGLRGSPLPSRTSRRRWWSCAARRPGHPARGGEAQRQLLRRGERASSAIPEAASRRRAPRRAARASSCRCPTETRRLLRQALRGWAASSRSSSRRPEKASPSAQLRISPRGRGAADLHPRPDPRRAQRTGLPGLPLPGRRATTGSGSRRRRCASARCSRRQGVVSRFGVDFLAWRREPAAEWNLAALEINLRMGGTTHPFLALQFLTGGQLDPRDRPLLLPHRAARSTTARPTTSRSEPTAACSPRT